MKVRFSMEMISLLLLSYLGYTAHGFIGIAGAMVGLLVFLAAGNVNE